ncbi:glucose/ribitol dehydrogenase [Artemisia annua]|uniref:Glucose/ribitol dehydrogenase n=1 Tax=Artemisia annua TaxID=35608 RepID=A0A2U1Q5T5_ARTAN|nr:glucose/ribitol dehydrogenase [Artemisia annua]
MTWISIFTGKSGYAASSTAEDVTRGVDGTGLTAIVTGATSGIGTETARVFALRGVHVVMPVRNIKSGNQVKKSIVEKIPNAKIEVMKLDISSMDSRSLNAGIMTPPFTLSKDNIELQFATNYVGNFYLTSLLLDIMRTTAKKSGIAGRVVIVSSEAHKVTYKEGIRFNKINDKQSYNALYAYGQSKLATILFASSLTRSLKSSQSDRVNINTLHPGVIKTNIARHGGFFSIFVNAAQYFLKNIPQGAATTCYVALHPQVKGISGQYFADSNLSKASGFAQDLKLADELRVFSWKLVGRYR